MQIIHDNLEIIVVILMVVVVILGISVWNLISASELNKENMENFIEWFNKTFSEGITKDMHEQKLEGQQLFVALWEYFYVLLATRGIFSVNVDTFMKDGMDDFTMRYPMMAGKMEVIDDHAQAKVFLNLFNHYEKGIKPRIKKETPEEIFNKYKPDKPIL